MRKKESNWVQRKQRQEEEREVKGQSRGAQRPVSALTSSVPQDTCVSYEGHLFIL